MNDLTSKTDRGIDDLIQQSHDASARIRVSPDDVEEKLQTKIHDIQEKKVEQVTQQRASQEGFPYISLKGFPVSPEALVLIPEAEARELKAVCFFFGDAEIRIGSVNPRAGGIDALRQRLENDTKARAEVYLISERSFEAALRLYAMLPKRREFKGGIELTGEDLENYRGKIGSFRDLNDQIQRVSTSDLFTMVVASALKANASDIHIETEQDDIKVRFRIDGVLYDVAIIDKKLWPKIISRVKLLAKLKLNVTDVPQDGRFTVYLTDEFIDVRVSTVPSAYGESIVMRLLMSSATGLELEDIGLVGHALDIIKQEIDRPNGMILTTGPTGSGKTTTLYAVVKKLNKPETKIITLENPIEYRVKGITQSQVEGNEQAESDQKDIRQMIMDGSGGKKHYTYAGGLRAVLRQDPDIVMVGEIRDHETAEISIQAALTGHLMLSTLHTNSAAGAIPRLLSMDVKPFLLAPALNVIVGQRLVRKICERCKEQYTPPPEIAERVGKLVDALPENLRGSLTRDSFKFYRGKGCVECSQIGYRGRIGIFEILTMNEEIEKLILTGQVSEYQIQAISKKHGMLTMAQDGILKVSQGITTPEEIFKATE
ncbi:MAG: GspE/PulE family protein [Patescibacteria group bacterium]